MANEFKHKTVGTQMTQSEYEAVGGHVLDSQAAGDLVYASSTTQLSRLGIGTAGKVLQVNSGASAPEWTAAITGVTSIHATDLIIGEDSETAIDFGTINEIDFKVDNAARLTLTTGALYPVTNNQIDLGTSSLEFKDAFFDGTVTADAFAGPLTGNVTGTASVATTITITDNESTDEDNAVVFTAGGDVDGGNLGLESDGNLTYNPSTGRLTATQLAGTLQTASQTNITGVGTISTGTWQGTAIASTYIAADAITGAKIADDAINSEHYTDGSIDTAHIADNQVTLAKMAGLTRGSLIIGDASGDPSALAKGTANYILTSDGTDIAWAAAPDATNASHVLVTDNESTNEENLVTFVEGATSSTGNVGLEMDGNLTYNPSSGTLTATAFAGALTGNVTGNVSGTAATVTTGVQSNITRTGTLDTLTVDNVITNGTTIGHTDDTDLMTLADGVLSVAGTLDVSGSVETATIDFTDGDNAITIADGGGTTFPQAATFTSGLTANGDITIADSKGIIIDSTPTDNGFNGIFASFDNATGATINRGEVVYVTGTANQVAKARGNADSTMPAVAIATADVTDGNSGNFMLHGICHDASKFPDLTEGGEVYVSEDTAGLVTSTLPADSRDRVQVVGIGLHNDKMLFNPSYDVVERG